MITTTEQLLARIPAEERAVARGYEDARHDEPQPLPESGPVDEAAWVRWGRHHWQPPEKAPRRKRRRAPAAPREPQATRADVFAAVMCEALPGILWALLDEATGAPMERALALGAAVGEVRDPREELISRCLVCDAWAWNDPLCRRCIRAFVARQAVAG